MYICILDVITVKNIDIENIFDILLVFSTHKISYKFYLMYLQYFTIILLQENILHDNDL